MNIGNELITATIEELDERLRVISTRVKQSEVNTCCEWLKDKKKLRGYGRISTYELKHVVERHADHRMYISQSSFIVAAQIMGFEPKPVSYYLNGSGVIKISPNV